MLLEKPFAISEEEVNYLYKVVKETGRKVMICHVLRYAPFYVAIKQRLLSGEIGDIINIQATEHVSYHHLAVLCARQMGQRRKMRGSDAAGKVLP